jgi:hypothetical protein
LLYNQNFILQRVQAKVSTIKNKLRAKFGSSIHMLNK